MIETYIKQLVDILYHQAIHCSLKNIKENLDSQEGLLQSSQMIKEAIYLSLLFCLNQGILDDSYFQSLLYQKCSQYIHSKKKTIKLKLQIRHLEHIYRIIEVPYMISLEELSYYILASLHAYGNHDFYLTLDKETYYENYFCGFYSEYMYASDFQLEELAIEKGSHIEMCYDFKEKYLIDIEVLDICEKKICVPAYIIESRGYGIWEEAHWLLELYYHNRTAFVTCIQDMGYDEDDFLIEECNRDCFIQDFKRIQENYMREKRPLPVS